MLASLFWTLPFATLCVGVSQLEVCNEAECATDVSALHAVWEDEPVDASLSLLQVSATAIRRAKRTPQAADATVSSTSRATVGLGPSLFQVGAESFGGETRDADREVNQVLVDTAGLAARVVGSPIDISDAALKAADTSAVVLVPGSYRSAVPLLGVLSVLLLATPFVIRRLSNRTPAQRKVDPTPAAPWDNEPDDTPTPCPHEEAPTAEVGVPGVREYAEGLALCPAAEINNRLPGNRGYDCAFSRPISSSQALRLEARVEGPVVGGCLISPLGGNHCVLFLAGVTRRVQDDMHPVSVAFSSASVDFSVSLVGETNVRIEVLAEDVSLFDMEDGKWTCPQNFEDAPEHWRNFVLAGCGRATTPLSQLREEPAPTLAESGGTLEFQECALRCGAAVTLVGELHRRADGTLLLQGCNFEGYTRRRVGPVSPDALRGKVLISDCSDLLTSPQQGEEP